MVQTLLFFHYQYFCSFSNPSSINYSILHTPNSVFQTTAIGNLGISEIRIEKRISFIVGIANHFILEGKHQLCQRELKCFHSYFLACFSFPYVWVFSLKLWIIILTSNVELKIPFCIGFLCPSISRYLFYCYESETSSTFLQGLSLKLYCVVSQFSSILKWDKNIYISLKVGGQHIWNFTWVNFYGLSVFSCGFLLGFSSQILVNCVFIAQSCWTDSCQTFSVWSYSL